MSLRQENTIERNHCFEGTKQIGANFSNISEPPTRRQKVSAVFLNVIFINKETKRSHMFRGQARLEVRPCYLVSWHHRRNFLVSQRWWADNVAETFWHHRGGGLAGAVAETFWNRTGGGLAPPPKLSGTTEVAGWRHRRNFLEPQRWQAGAVAETKPTYSHNL